MNPDPMEAAIRASLEAIDRAKEEVEKERKKLERERDAAIRARRKAEREGEKIAEAYFEKARTAMAEFTRKEQLRDLTRAHLEKGRAIEDICSWLGVDRKFVEAIVEVMDRRVDYRREMASRNRIRIGGNPRLSYRDEGRSGTIIFENDRAKFDMWWEFGTGRTLVFIAVPSPSQWESRASLREDDREQTLRWIAEQVIEDKCASANHGFEIGDAYLTIFR